MGWEERDYACGMVVGIIILSFRFTFVMCGVLELMLCLVSQILFVIAVILLLVVIIFDPFLLDCAFPSTLLITRVISLIP